MAAELHAFDLATGVPRGRLRASKVKWSEGLNAELGLRFRLDLAHRPTREVAPFLRSGGTKIVLHDPPVTRSFIVWERSYTQRRFLQVRAAGLWSWFNQRPLDRTFRYRGADQHAIAAELVEWAQRGGGVGVGVEWSASGRRRDRTYKGFENAMVGDRVAELAAVEDGFNFTIETTFDGHVAVSDTWRPLYPRAGVSWPASGARVDLDGSATDLDVDEFAPISHQRELGAGEGKAMRVADHSVSLPPQYPPLWRVEGRKTVELVETLREHARADLAAHNAAAESWSPTVLDRFGTVRAMTVGDECQLVVGAGDYLWPDGYETVRRLVGRDVTISDKGGPDRVTLQLESVVS